MMIVTIMVSWYYLSGNAPIIFVLPCRAERGVARSRFPRVIASRAQRGVAIPCSGERNE